MSAEPPVPRESALGVVVRRTAAGWEVLLGRRARGARFMPGNLVFPGGVLERGDGEGEQRWRCGASRELAEETGILVHPEAWRDLGVSVTTVASCPGTSNRRMPRPLQVNTRAPSAVGKG